MFGEGFESSCTLWLFLFFFFAKQVACQGKIDAATCWRKVKDFLDCQSSMF